MAATMDPALYNEVLDTLHEMAPALDRDIIAAVLEANGGSLERTVESLLQMSSDGADAQSQSVVPPDSRLPADFLTLGDVAPHGRLDQRRDQELSDFELAKRLQEEENRMAQRAGSSTAQREAPIGKRDEPSFKEKWASFSDATKKKFRELQAKISGKKKPVEYATVSADDHHDESVPLKESENAIIDDEDYHDYHGAAADHPEAFEDSQDSLMTSRSLLVDNKKNH